MQLLVYYVVFVAVGDFAAYLTGYLVERFWGSTPSLVVFLGLYFLLLWVAWVIAVKVTEPKSTRDARQALSPQSRG
jgi:hypothetical protein